MVVRKPLEKIADREESMERPSWTEKRYKTFSKEEREKIEKELDFLGNCLAKGREYAEEILGETRALNDLETLSDYFSVASVNLTRARTALEINFPNEKLLERYKTARQIHDLLFDRAIELKKSEKQ